MTTPTSPAARPRLKQGIESSPAGTNTPNPTASNAAAADFEASAERARIFIQAEIDGRRSARERNRLGQFATPQPLALDIARACQRFLSDMAPNYGCDSADSAPIRFGEPSIGTGAFYSAARRVFGTDRIISAVGVEIDPAFAQAALNIWGERLSLVEGDFTDPAVRALAVPRPNLILANPPYVRHHHLNAPQKESLRGQASAAGVSVSGLAGLYVYFVLLAHNWLEDDGMAAWLLPSEFMDVNYGTALKHYLTEKVTLLGIHRFDPDAVQFDDALVSSAVVFFRKVAPPADWAARFTFGGAIENPSIVQEVPLSELRRARKWTAYPRQTGKDDKDSLFAVAANSTISHNGHDLALPATSARLVLGDLFRIRRGIATGANEFFILPRSEARDRGFPDSCLRPVLPSPRALRGTSIIERGSDGYPLLPSPQVVIDSSLPAAEIRKHFPQLWEYLEEGRRQGVADGYLVSRRTPWYSQEKRTPAPFLCTYMGRGLDNGHPFRFLLNTSDALATNVYLMLYPTGQLAQLLQRQPDAALEVLKVLSEIAPASLKDEGRVYGGGLHKIEPKELARLDATSFIARFPELKQQYRLFDIDLQ